MVILSVYYKHCPVCEGIEFASREDAESYLEKLGRKPHVSVIIQTLSEYCSALNDAAAGGNPHNPLPGNIAMVIEAEYAHIRKLFSKPHGFTFAAIPYTHRWGSDPVITPVILMKDGKTVYATLDESSILADIEWDFLPKALNDQRIAAIACAA